MSHYVLQDRGDKKDLPAFLDRHVPGYRRGEPWRGRVGVQGIPIVRAALTALVRCDSMTELLRACVAFTGDTDTVASIALGSAAHSRAYRQDFSRTLYYKLEATPYGRHYIAALDKELLSLRQQNRPRKWFLF